MVCGCVESSTTTGAGLAATLTEAATSATAAAAMATTGNRMGRLDISHTLSYTPRLTAPSALRQVSEIVVPAMDDLCKLRKEFQCREEHGPPLEHAAGGLVGGAEDPGSPLTKSSKWRLERVGKRRQRLKCVLQAALTLASYSRSCVEPVRSVSNQLRTARCIYISFTVA